MNFLSEICSGPFIICSCEMNCWTACWMIRCIARWGIDGRFVGCLLSDLLDVSLDHLLDDSFDDMM